MKKYWLIEDWGADGYIVFYDSDDLDYIKQKRIEEGRERTAYIVQVIEEPDYND